MITDDGAGATPHSSRPEKPGSRPEQPGSRPEHRGGNVATWPQYLGFAVLGSLMPGASLIAAGRRRLGAVVLGAWLGCIVGVGIAAVRLGRSGLIELSSDPAALRLITAGLVTVGALWLIVAVISLYYLQPPRLSAPKRLAGAAAVIATTSFVVAPFAIAAQYSNTHSDLIDRIFASIDDQRSLTSPTEAPDAADPWANMPRVNILLLGSDAGDGREGVRPDTLIVASVDTRTGRTILLSLPRNLERVPFPADSPLHERYPFGFTGQGDRRNWMINAIYDAVPVAHPDVFAGSSYPGADATKWAVEGALGIDIDYFVMVNLAGFQEVIDALGGITIDVHYRVPIGTQLDPRTGLCTVAREWIEPGLNQHLDGARALWYARARCGPPPVTDDFNRMERQRCVIGAIVDEVNPLNVLRHYERLAGAAGDLVLTDIPQELLSSFVALAEKVQDAPITSLAFTDDVIASRSSPDFEQIQRLAAEAVDPPPTRGPDQTQTPGSAESPSSMESTPPPGSAASEVPSAGPAASEGPAAADETNGLAPDGTPGPDPATAQPLDAVC